MIRRLLASGAILGLLALTVAAPVQAQPRNKSKDLVQTAQAAGSFKTLLKAIRIAGLQSTLKTGGPFTVFAPTDEAFAKLPPATLSAVLADPALLKSILLYHVVEGTVLAKDVVTLSNAPTLNGKPVAIAVVDGGVVLNGGVKVTATDVMAKNGVIHVVDTVLMPK